MKIPVKTLMLLALAAGSAAIGAETVTAYDPALAAQLGADEHGMRPYVVVILKSGPTPVPKGEKRDAMFKGHFANMQRLAEAGLLVYAGPLDGQNGLRGLFIFATKDLDAARQAVDTDPVIVNGEMVADLHRHFGSAALLAVNEWHPKLIKPKP